MIKFSQITTGQRSRLIRETTAPFIINDKAGERTETIRVRYYSLSIKESKEFTKELARKDNLYVSDLLLPIIAELPDIVDDKGKPMKITQDVLDSLNTLNLRAIQKAIETDLAGKVQPSR